MQQLLHLALHAAGLSPSCRQAQDQGSCRLKPVMCQHSTTLPQSNCPEAKPGKGCALWYLHVPRGKALMVRLTSLQTLQLLLHPQKHPFRISIGEAINPASCGLLQTCNQKNATLMRKWAYAASPASDQFPIRYCETSAGLPSCTSG